MNFVLLLFFISSMNEPNPPVFIVAVFGLIVCLFSFTFGFSSTQNQKIDGCTDGQENQDNSQPHYPSIVSRNKASEQQRLSHLVSSLASVGWLLGTDPKSFLLGDIAKNGTDSKPHLCLPEILQNSGMLKRLLFPFQFLMYGDSESLFYKLSQCLNMLKTYK